MLRLFSRVQVISLILLFTSNCKVSKENFDNAVGIGTHFTRETTSPILWYCPFIPNDRRAESEVIEIISIDNKLVPPTLIIKGEPQWPKFVLLPGEHKIEIKGTCKYMEYTQTSSYISGVMDQRALVTRGFKKQSIIEDHQFMTFNFKEKRRYFIWADVYKGKVKWHLDNERYKIDSVNLIK